jgi:hypothetical protein
MKLAISRLGFNLSLHLLGIHKDSVRSLMRIRALGVISTTVEEGHRCMRKQWWRCSFASVLRVLMSMVDQSVRPVSEDSFSNDLFLACDRKRPLQSLTQ